MRLVMISDTHGQHEELDIPDGDCLIHAGDFTGYDSPEALDAFAGWLESQPHRHKVLIAGNHDRCFQQQPTATKARFQGWVHYLKDSGCELEGIQIWGSPWTPRFFLIILLCWRGVVRPSKNAGSVSRYQPSC